MHDAGKMVAAQGGARRRKPLRQRERVVAQGIEAGGGKIERRQPGVLARTVEAYRKIRNTLRFLVSNLYDFDPADRLPLDRMQEVDR